MAPRPAAPPPPRNSGAPILVRTAGGRTATVIEKKQRGWFVCDLDGNANEGKSCNGGGSMCHSLPSTGPSLTLDLCTPESATTQSGPKTFCKGTATFDVVKIFNRVNCCKNRLGAFEVYMITCQDDVTVRRGGGGGGGGGAT